MAGSCLIHARRVCLDAYSIERCPVTVAQYARFTGRAAPAGKESRPVVDDSWSDAVACAVTGRRECKRAHWRD